MLTTRQAEDILMGAALMENIGNLYEYDSRDGNHLFFRCITSNKRIEITYQRMIEECAIIY